MKRTQGEIFGLALLFVVIVVGIVIYGQIRALSPQREVDVEKEREYKIVAEGTLNTILKLSTGCYVERGRDSVESLIRYCMEESFGNIEPVFSCSNGEERVCIYANEIIEGYLFSLFGEEGEVGHIPFSLRINLTSSSTSSFNNQIISNLDEFGEEEGVSYKRLGLNRVSSGLRTLPTAQRDIEFELYLFYK